MKLKTLNLTLLITAVLVVIAAIAAFQGYSSVQNLRAEQQTLLHQANEISLLKKRRSIQESQSSYDFLKNHPKLVKHEKRGGNFYFEYGDLSRNEFDQLSNKILNSMLMIKKLTLRRNGGSKGIILVEIES